MRRADAVRPADRLLWRRRGDDPKGWFLHRDVRMTARSEFTRVLPVHVPTVMHKGPNDSDASRFRRAADNLDRGYSIGGSATRASVAELLRQAADVLDRNNQPDPPFSFHGVLR